eukprot:s2660_g12.t2
MRGRLSLGKKVEELSRCHPGTRVAAYFEDDKFYHERILLWCAGGTQWVILTPDYDVYIGDFSGIGDPGCDHFKIKGIDFSYWSRVGGAAYRFGDQPSDEELKQRIEEAIDLIGDQVRAPDAWRPSKIFLGNGTLEDANVFLGRSLVSRRLRGKGPPVREADGHRDHNMSSNQVGPIKPVAPAGDGMVWVAAEPLAGLILGQEVSLSSSSDFQVGDRVALMKRGEVWVKAELVKLEDCADYASRRRALFVEAAPARASLADEKLLQLAGPAAASEEKSEESRTLWVDFDEHGERFKRWRDVCKECYSPVHEDKPLDGPLTALYFIKHAERHGGDMRQWLQLWCRAKHVDPTDRVYHELKVLTDALHYAGTHDQLNIPALISMEGQGSPEDIVSPVFRSYAAKKNKEELELLQARQRVRELRGSPAVAPDDAGGDGADGQGAKPTKGPKTKGRGRGQDNA